MTIAQTLTNQFLLDEWLAYFSAGSFKIALYTSDADLGKLTTKYATAGEISGAGYQAGGATLAKMPGYPQVDPTGLAYMHFADPSWEGSSFTTRAALIYRISDGGSVLILDFSRDYTMTGQVFRIRFGTSLPQDALIRAKAHP